MKKYLSIMLLVSGVSAFGMSEQEKRDVAVADAAHELFVQGVEERSTDNGGLRKRRNVSISDASGASSGSSVTSTERGHQGTSLRRSLAKQWNRINPRTRLYVLSGSVMSACGLIWLVQHLTGSSVPAAGLSSLWSTSNSTSWFGW